ncbi:MAG: hypothetical protein HYR91_08350 [Flavobacteriia bacterium]|nr:hypothetical protein [Flavobacteriia bacterium]
MNWVKDFRLLEAFCYEGIFNDLEKDNSKIDKKKEAYQKYKSKIITLDKYLEDVKKRSF